MSRLAASALNLGIKEGSLTPHTPSAPHVRGFWSQLHGFLFYLLPGLCRICQGPAIIYASVYRFCVYSAVMRPFGRFRAHREEAETQRKQ
ncbi:hypothetical protein NDU88_006344 [Pleurodeles waltl]|uniref:Uncharacterized protein n=1 Tax=Pleurodeles waltl TaxID=8319 RepID=A0AAV7QNB0_PLEWA|nr:hypothetical protein NDU88_006344 [Pleurodeles waltl]